MVQVLLWVNIAGFLRIWYWSGGGGRGNMGKGEGEQAGWIATWCLCCLLLCLAAVGEGFALTRGTNRSTSSKAQDSAAAACARALGGSPRM